MVIIYNRRSFLGVPWQQTSSRLLPGGVESRVRSPERTRRAYEGLRPSSTHLGDPHPTLKRSGLSCYRKIYCLQQQKTPQRGVFTIFVQIRVTDSCFYFGTNAMSPAMRDCLIADAAFLWCFEQRPVLRRAPILR